MDLKPRNLGFSINIRKSVVKYIIGLYITLLSYTIFCCCLHVLCRYKGYRVGSLGSLSDRHRIATKLDDSIWGRRHGYGGIGTKPSTVPEPVLIGAEFPRSHKHFTSGIHPHPRCAYLHYYNKNNNKNNKLLILFRTYSIQPLYKTSLDLGSERLEYSHICLMLYQLYVQ